MMALFKNRTDASQKLASTLAKYAERDDVVVLGLPRGGVPVAYGMKISRKRPMRKSEDYCAKHRKT